MNRPSRPGPSEKLVAAIGETRALSRGHGRGPGAGRAGKARFAGFASNLGTAKQGKVTDAAPDRDPIGVVSDVSDGRATPVGLGGATATPVSLGGGTGAARQSRWRHRRWPSVFGGGTGAAVSLGGGTGGLVGVPAGGGGTAIRLQGPDWWAGNCLAPLLPRLPVLLKLP